MEVTYSVLMQDEPIHYESAFDYKSIFTYSGDETAGRTKTETPNQSAKDTDLLSRLVSTTFLCLSYAAIFFTLPISVWFCFKTLPQWERLVIYRLGKLEGVKGPGNIFVIPWLDTCMKLDLRTQLITNPVKQFLTRDQAIVEAGSTVHYRIVDPLCYASTIKDPELCGLKQLAYAISIKRMQEHREKDFLDGKKTYVEQEIQKELNTALTSWGIEISSVEINGYHVLNEARPVNAFLNVMKQLGLSTFIEGSAAGDLLQATTSMAVGGEKGSFGLKSANAIRMQGMLHAANVSVDTGAIICLKIGPDETFYVDFTQGKGLVSEVAPGRLDMTVSLANQATFDMLVKGTSQSQFLQSYLTGDISVDGDMDALIQLQKILPNMQTG